MSTGNVEITIFCARGIKPTAFSRRNDIFSHKEYPVSAFAAVDVDGTYVFKTNTYPKSNNPFWNQSTKFEVHNAKNMRFIVFDKKARDSYISDLAIPVNSSIRRKWVDLNPTGCLYISAEFKESNRSEEFNGHKPLKISPPRVFVVNHHRFLQTSFRQPTLCSICQGFIWGITKREGIQCHLCAMVAHNNCYRHTVFSCPQSNKKFQNTQKIYPETRIWFAHSFIKFNYLRPTMCRHCGSLLYGLFSQGLRCTICNMDIHKRCLQSVPNHCGVDRNSIVVNEGLQGRLESPERPDLAIEFTIKNGTSETLNHLCSKISRIDEVLKIGHFNVIKVIGQGLFGKVLLAEKKSDNKSTAIKVIRKWDLQRTRGVASLLLERDCLSIGSEHNFLGKLIASFQNQDYVFLATEFYPGGDLMFRLDERKVFDEFESVFYSGEVAIALNYLHQLEIIYRDVTLENVMLDKDGHVRLVDFGTCKANINLNLATTVYGELDYAPPESLLHIPYGKSADWWSFGVLLYEFLVGENPFDGETADELIQNILHCEIAIPALLSDNSRQILIDLLERNPEHRLGSRGGSDESEIFRHEFYTSKISFEDLQQRKIKPPWIPELNDNFDVKYFDEQPKKVFFPKIDKKLLLQVDQTEFIDFDLTTE